MTRSTHQAKPLILTWFLPILLLAASFLLLKVEATGGHSEPEVDHYTVTDICSTYQCYYNTEKLDVSAAFDLVPTICTNLVGANSEFGYFKGERRANCHQMENGEQAWKYDFVITRTKEEETYMYLDNKSCQDAMKSILAGEITGCNDPSLVTASEILGGTQQVGVFYIQVIPNPGLCGLPLLN